mmetsp:Transcript_6080/g.15386  ORF Transcript_6080/g.15386 Transcript_6080/m.15386 type:complete len:239 (-) Transcript_6080:435-1151(-)
MHAPRGRIRALGVARQHRRHPGAVPPARQLRTAVLRPSAQQPAGAPGAQQRVGGVEVERAERFARTAEVPQRRQHAARLPRRPRLRGRHQRGHLAAGQQRCEAGGAPGAADDAEGLAAPGASELPHPVHLPALEQPAQQPPAAVVRQQRVHHLLELAVPAATGAVARRRLRGRQLCLQTRRLPPQPLQLRLQSLHPEQQQPSVALLHHHGPVVCACRRAALLCRGRRAGPRGGRRRSH